MDGSRLGIGVGIGGGPAATQARDRGAVSIQMDTYEKMRGALRQYIGELEQRLQPVLRIMPAPPPSGEMPKDPRVQTLADQMLRGNEDLGAMVNWLQDIIQRLEL